MAIGFAVYILTKNESIIVEDKKVPKLIIAKKKSILEKIKTPKKANQIEKSLKDSTDIIFNRKRQIDDEKIAKCVGKLNELIIRPENYEDIQIKDLDKQIQVLNSYCLYNKESKDYLLDLISKNKIVKLKYLDQGAMAEDRFLFLENFQAFMRKGLNNKQRQNLFLFLENYIENTPVYFMVDIKIRAHMLELFLNSCGINDIPEIKEMSKFIDKEIRYLHDLDDLAFRSKKTEDIEASLKKTNEDILHFMVELKNIIAKYKPELTRCLK